MKRLPLVLLLVGLSGLELLLVAAAGGFLRYAVLVSIVPLASGAVGISLTLQQRKKSERAAVPQTAEPSAAVLPEKILLPSSPSAPEKIVLQAVRPRVYKAALPALFLSIVNYINKTSVPMSETLVKIKTVIADFTSGVHKSKSSFDDKNYTADRKTGIEQLIAHITDITNETSKSFSDVSVEIERLNGQMMSILDIVGNISDVAERIHVLSINASIEAARSGVHGRGFKVIADEIQRLSKETQSFVTTIGSTVGATKAAFGSLHGTMQNKQKGIERMVMEDSSTYDALSHTIERQLADFTALYSSTVSFIESIDVDMSTLFPLAMLHAIITQEIENLGKVSDDLIDLIERQSADPAAFALSFADQESMDRLRKRLTTSRELDALDEALQGIGFREQYNLKRTNTSIEFF